ncbi:hypothetical protein BC629DRAFT_1455445 [Irpex lacteus]|nr:hypothetical protein BC629DRAFT_1455445 [Irpex lacteus]
MPSAVAQPTYRLKLVNRPQSPYLEVEVQVIGTSHLKLEGPDEHDREFMKAGLRAYPGLCSDLANELAQQERQLQDRLAARLAQRRILLDERWRALVSMTLGVIRDYDEQIHCCLRQEHAAGTAAMNSDSLYLGGISIRMSITTFGTLPRGIYDLWAGEMTIRCTDLVDYVLQR